MISLYDSKEINFNNNGSVILSDCISCNVAEELNGSFELDLEYPLDERGKWKQLLDGNIIKSDGQLFRIYRKIKTLSGIKINARHIYYDLLDNFLEDVRPTNLSGTSAVSWVLTHTQYTHPFVSLGDVGGSNTQYFVRKNPVEAITTIINTWGGELVRDNFEIKLMQARGLDREVLVAYGKNIEGVEETLDMDSMCTRLMPIGKDGLLLTEKYVDSQYINNYPHPIIKVVEFTDIEIEEELRSAGQSYILDSKCDIPQYNYKINFLELSKTEEYKNYIALETVYMGDTVTIKHSKLNINLKAKVIKITKNILTGRIIKVELGSFKDNIATVISKSIKAVTTEIAQVTNAYQLAIENATDLITGSKGGNVVIRQDGDGKPYEILIMDTDDINTALNVWRWNLGGFGHSDTGINGPFDVAITQDGHIVASFITALEITGQQVTTGVLSSLDGSVSINLDNGEFSFGGSTGNTTLTKDYVRVAHDDGSYTKMDATGFKRHTGITDKDYHYLTAEGYVSLTTDEYTGSASTIVTLPDEFKGKDFKPILSVRGAYPHALLMTMGAYQNEGDIDIANGKFTIRGSLWSVNLDHIASGAGEIKISWYVIA